MNQAFWKTYKSKVLQTLSGESEEDLAEEVGTIHACWVGRGRGAAGVKGTRKSKGQLWGEGIFVQKPLAHSGMTNGMVQKARVFKKTEEEDLGATRRMVIVSKDLKGYHTEEILPGPVGSSHPGYMGLDNFLVGRAQQNTDGSP